MKRTTFAWLSFGLLMGCAGSEPAAPPATTQNSTPAAPGDPELSTEDKAAAEKQGICPVTGEKLFGHGTPVKVTVKDRTVFLCCQPCDEALQKDPDKYLAKLDAKPAESTTTEPAAAPADAPKTENPPAVN